MFDKILNKKILLLAVVGILIAVALSGFSYFKSHPIQIPSFTTNISKQVAKKTPLKNSTSNLIKTTFASSSNKQAVTYLNLALSEKNPDLSYQYYLKTYSEMNQEYSKTKDLKVKLAMIRFASYLSTLPQYKEADVVIPE